MVRGRCLHQGGMRSHVECAKKSERGGWGSRWQGREGRRGGAAELRGERQNLVVSPGGGDALQAPECTQTLSHRGAAQPERARHRALCEREREGGREEDVAHRLREEEKSKRPEMGRKGEGEGGFMREVGRSKQNTR